MIRVIGALVALVLLMTGCSQLTESFQGNIDAIQANGFLVECSDEASKGKKSVNSLGYICSVSYTNDTKFKDVSGKNLTPAEFLPGSEVKVILSKPIHFKRDFNKLLTAKEMILMQRVEQVAPYDFKRDEVIKVTIYLGGYIGGSGTVLAEIADQEELDELSEILQNSPPFHGNSSSDWNYTIVVMCHDGSEREIEITGRVNVFIDRSEKNAYSLDKKSFTEYVERYQKTEK